MENAAQRLARVCVLGPVLTVACVRQTWTPPGEEVVNRMAGVFGDFYQKFAGVGAYSLREQEEIGLRLVKSSSRTWLEDLRAILFSPSVEPRLRFAAGHFLSIAGDRASYRRLLREMRDPRFRIPTGAAIQMLGRVSKRRDVPELIELLRQRSSWVRLCSAWALFHVTYNYLGSPDQGIRELRLYERWSEWWKKHRSESKTAWFRMGIESCLVDLKSDSPSRRARAVVRVRFLADSFVPNALYVPAEAEPWERWWRDRGPGIVVEEASDLVAESGSAPWVSFLIAHDPYWGADEDTFEEVMRGDLRRRIDSFRRGCDAISAEGVERLTNVKFSVSEELVEEASVGFRNVPRTEDFPLAAKWTEWYRANAQDLSWDWTRGHFVTARAAAP